MTDELVTLIEDFRADLEAEIPKRLHLRTGDVGAEYATVTTRRSQSGATGWTGPPFTGSFLRYLGHPDEYGYEFIAAAAFQEIAAYCRSKHDESHCVGSTDSLCRRLAVAVVELRQPLAFVAAQEGIGIFAVRRHLVDVLKHAEEWRRKRMDAASLSDQQRQESADDPIGTMLAQQHLEGIEERVWARLRAKYPELPEWTVEQERRRIQHRRLGCPRCMVDVA